MGGFLFVCAFALLAFGILALTFHSPILTKVYCALGVLLTGVYIIFDTQLIVGGFQYELSIDDYIVGALMLYVDIIVMFIRILRLFKN